MIATSVLKKHISIVTKTAYLRNISKVRDILSPSDSKKLVHAFVTSRLDYCSSVFAGLPKSSIKHLQRVQNAAAQMLTRCKIRNHITPTLRSLHWLPVSFRIEFKILLSVFKCLHGTAPIYLSNLLNKYTPVRSLRTSNRNLLVVPKTRLKIGESAFSYFGPNLWNSLPDNLRAIDSLCSFKKYLKTHLFTRAFPWLIFVFYYFISIMWFNGLLCLFLCILSIL